MQLLLALLAGILTAAGVYLLLRRSLLRMVFGLVLLSNAVNLLVFSMGRVARLAPPLVPEGLDAPPGLTANPLPQALVLTAIVIGFGLVAFALALVYRGFVTLGTTKGDALAEGEEDAGGGAMGDAFPDPAAQTEPTPSGRPGVAASSAGSPDVASTPVSPQEVRP
jgi:multicomponent Na+:H+ antiporter subunit C